MPQKSGLHFDERQVDFFLTAAAFVKKLLSLTGEKMHVFPKGCYFKSISDIREKRVTVMGLGLNGGGEACVRFFLRHGAFVLATDTKTKEQLRPTLDSLECDSSLDKSRLSYALGGHKIEDFKNSDCVIKNPGVKIEGNPFLAAASAIETDISLFLHFSKSPVIAVTGSKGKSSTVSAIHYGLQKAGFDSFLGGNITVSPLNFLERTGEKTPVVLELSSWQLADLRGRGLLKPKIALITKIVPDHQNWYASMAEYVSDKKLIYADQSEDDFLICDADADQVGTGPAGGGRWGDEFAREAKSKVLRYSQDELLPNEFGAWLSFDQKNNLQSLARIPSRPQTQKILGAAKVPGRHLFQNVMNAALVLYLMGVEADAVSSILGGWSGIPHRLQFFHSWKIPAQKNSANENSANDFFSEEDSAEENFVEKNSAEKNFTKENSAEKNSEEKFASANAQKIVRFYNDSCSTVPEAAAAASGAFGKPVVFIAGGTDKGLDFLPLAASLSEKNFRSTAPAALYLLEGSGTQKLCPLLKERGVFFKGPFASIADLLFAMRADFESGRLNCDTVVFSPGATSFGMFSNEFERGEKFMEEAKRIFCE